MPVCAVKLCRNYVKKTNNNTKITFHRFPTDPILGNCWTKIIKRTRNDDQWKPHRTSIVCSDHFSEDDLYFTKKGLRRIKNGSVPSKRLHIDCTEEIRNVPHIVSKNESENSTDDLKDSLVSDKTLLATSSREANENTYCNDAQASNEPGLHIDSSSSSSSTACISPLLDIGLSQFAPMCPVGGTPHIDCTDEIKNVPHIVCKIESENSTDDLKDPLVSDKTLLDPSSPEANENTYCNDAQASNEPISQEYESDLDSIFDTPRESVLRRQLARKIKLQNKHRNMINALQKRNRRLTEKNKSLKKVIKELKKKK